LIRADRLGHGGDKTLQTMWVHETSCDPRHVTAGTRHGSSSPRTRQSPPGQSHQKLHRVLPRSRLA
jgi:hypothetical protein